MKWGLFIISIGALIICLAGNPSSALNLRLIASGLLTVAVGIFVMYASSKMAKRKAQREALEKEEAEFKAEQARKKEEASRQKMLDNVEKSRRNSSKE